MRERIAFEREMAALLRPELGPKESSTPLGEARELSDRETPASWDQAIFRAVWGGERRINNLIKIGRAAGAPSDTLARGSALNLLRVPFPKASSGAPIRCEKVERSLAPASPDNPKINFTGRFQSSKKSGLRYFWAINQAGNALIAIRTQRGYNPKLPSASRQYIELRGDLQADGTAVLFRTDKPEAFWGYLQQLPNRTFRWHDKSYLGPDGKRVMVDADPALDEVLEISEDKRPTMMESLIKSPDDYLTALLQQREWFPLTKTAWKFLDEGARSDLLRTLLTNYLRTPKGITYKEEQAKITAAGMVSNYLAHLLWHQGSKITQPGIIGSDDLQAHARHARKLLPYGFHSNWVLARHVTKEFLSLQKIEHQGDKRSFLDWITKIVQDEQEERLSTLLDIPLTSANKGTHRYRLKLVAVSGAFYVGGLSGTLTVEKLTSPTWKGTYDVSGGVGGIKIPTVEEVFDLVVKTDQEWMPDDFEGKLFIGGVSASFGLQKGRAGGKAGANAMGAYLKSKNGLWLTFEDADWSIGPGKGGGKGSPTSPKFKAGFEGMVLGISRSSNRIIDFSRPFLSDRAVTGGLTTATHFCSDSAWLTPAARQLLRLVCADQLALLTQPSTTVSIVGHTDRMDTASRNIELSLLRAQNVKQALIDILGDPPAVPKDAIRALGMGEWMASLNLRRDQVRNPTDRRVDLLINGSIVASFRDHT